MKFFVNFLSAFHIAAAFAIIPTLMLNMYWTTFVLYALGAISDWFDGFLARKYNVCTKIGGVMDHIGDKLLVVNTCIMLAIMMPVWFVVVPIIIMIARELTKLNESFYRGPLATFNEKSFPEKGEFVILVAPYKI